MTWVTPPFRILWTDPAVARVHEGLRIAGDKVNLKGPNAVLLHLIPNPSALAAWGGNYHSTSVCGWGNYLWLIYCNVAMSKAIITGWHSKHEDYLKSCTWTHMGLHCGWYEFFSWEAWKGHLGRRTEQSRAELLFGGNKYQAKHLIFPYVKPFYVRCISLLLWSFLKA